jgi:hypothetical protein
MGQRLYTSFTVKDRANLSDVSDDRSCYLDVPVSELPIDTLLPSATDSQCLTNEFSVLVGRVLVSELRYFRDTFTDVISNYTPHQYRKEMSRKSEIVCCIFNQYHL